MNELVHDCTKESDVYHASIVLTAMMNRFDLFHRKNQVSALMIQVRGYDSVLHQQYDVDIPTLINNCNYEIKRHKEFLTEDQIKKIKEYFHSMTVEEY